MSSAYTNAELDERIASTKTRIVAIEAAIDKVIGGAQMYSLDSGQTRQMVTRASLGQLKELLSSTEQRLDRLCRERGVSGTTYVRPAF
jgi:hypothetical protein